MKTRREFFKTLAGSMAVVAACVIAPKSLMAKEEKLLHTVEERLDNIDSWITITEIGEKVVGISRKRSSQEYNSPMAWTKTTGWTPRKGT